MDEKPFVFGCQPVMMKDQNMSLHRCPSEEYCLCIIQSPINKDPDGTKEITPLPYAFVIIQIQRPRINRDFIEYTNDKKDDDSMVVKSNT